jgi:hypothetical protein
MLRHGSLDPSCKDSDSDLSRNRHSFQFASYPAAGLSIGFFLVTCFVLFKDVWDGAAITTDHVMSFAVLVGIFASGHLIWGQLEQWRLLPALGLLILFGAGTVYCVTASGGRSAAAAGSKAETVHKANEDRATLEADLTTARERLTEDEAKECATGEGSHCKGWRATAQERQTYVNVLETQLKRMDPARLENPELHHAAKLFAAMPWVTASEDKIFAALVLFFPFIKALFCEVATLVFGGIGFNRRRRATLSPSVASDERVKALKTRGATLAVPVKELPDALHFRRQQVTPLQREAALADLLTLGAVPSQETLAARWHRSEATVSRWVRLWESKGQIHRKRNGRCVRLGV